MNRRSVSARRTLAVLAATTLLSGCGGPPTVSTPLPAPDAARATQPPAATPGLPPGTPGAAPPTPAAPVPAGAGGTAAPLPARTAAPPRQASRSATPAVAPAGRPAPATRPALVPAEALPAVDRARDDLARRLAIAADTIEVVGVQIEYESAGASESPGQPKGWRVRLAAGNTVYTYQIDSHGRPRPIDRPR